VQPEHLFRRRDMRRGRQEVPHDRKHAGHGPDADGDRQNGREGKAEVPPESADRVSDVARDGVQPSEAMEIVDSLDD
jgi:hypothetical protein